MTTYSTTAEDRLAELGVKLPDAPKPFGAYVPDLCYDSARSDVGCKLSRVIALAGL